MFIRDYSGSVLDVQDDDGALDFCKNRKIVFHFTEGS